MTPNDLSHHGLVTFSFSFLYLILEISFCSHSLHGFLVLCLVFFQTMFLTVVVNEHFDNRGQRKREHWCIDSTSAVYWRRPEILVLKHTSLLFFSGPEFDSAVEWEFLTQRFLRQVQHWFFEKIYSIWEPSSEEQAVAIFL